MKCPDCGKPIDPESGPLFTMFQLCRVLGVEKMAICTCGKEMRVPVKNKEKRM